MYPEDTANLLSGEKASRRLKLLNEAADGRHERLQCPECDQPTVSVWFTHPEGEFYRIWFLCSACTFHTRVQCVDKPAHFSEGRRRMDLEEKDTSILKKSTFKRPSILLE
jgi:hypothetical protein